MKKIWRYFQDHFPAEEKEDEPPGIAFAAAALMIEVSRSDQVRQEIEQTSILDSLKSQFEFTDGELEALVASAEETVEDANDLHQFTRLINEHYQYDQRQNLVVQLWRVAYADGRIDKFEEYIIRRIAGLLHLDNRDFVRARLTARDSTG